MNDSELNEILRAAKVPERPLDFWSEFPGRVSARLKRTEHAPARPRAAAFPKFAWALAGVGACLLVGFYVGHWRGRTEAMAEQGLLQNEKIIREMLTLFPNRVRAIVQNEHGLNLVLSDKADVSLSTPIWVRVCDGKHCTAIVTFSGQDVQLGRQEITVLADPGGKIIVAGDNFLWSNGKALLAGENLKIEAKSLAPVGGLGI